MICPDEEAIEDALATCLKGQATRLCVASPCKAEGDSINVAERR